MPLHAGYREQPQNWVPACRPCEAVRFFMAAPQMGHAGAAPESATAGLEAVCLAADSGWPACSTERIIFSSSGPSISRIPFFSAKATASGVNEPDVTRMP